MSRAADIARWGACFLAMVVVATSGLDDARANGRFPASNAILFPPDGSAEGLVTARMTFGLLVSRDRGVTWDWVCDRSIGTVSEDPTIAWTSERTMLAGTKKGLVITRDDACSFEVVGAPIAPFPIVDVSARALEPARVVVLASNYLGLDDAGEFRFDSRLFETGDEGRSFTVLSEAIDPMLLGETVDVAPSDPDRIYLSGQYDLVNGRTGYLLASTDRGRTFESHQIALTPSERAVFIAAVDPSNPDRVFLRTDGEPGTPGRLLVTDDRGATFRVVFTSQGALAGFALARDGAKVFVGGPKDGVHVALTSDFGFTQRSMVPVDCLAIAADGLWACSTEKAGFVVGVSRDEGTTFEPKLHFCDVRGVFACAPGSTTAACSWPPQRDALGCGPPGDVSDGSTDVDAGGAPSAPVDDASGCGCATAPDQPAMGAAVLLLAGTALWRRRIRRR